MSTDGEKLESMISTPSQPSTQLSNQSESSPQSWTKKRKCSITFVYSSKSKAERKLESILPHSLLSTQPNNTNESNPRNWNKKKKYPIAFFALLSAFVATIGTPLYFAAIPSIATSYSISTELATVPASLYAFGLSIGGLLATASEIFGRKIVYQLSIPLSLIFTLLGGFATNFPTIAASRFLAGLFAGPCTTVGAGVLNDLWDASQRTGYIFAALFSFAIITATAVGAMASSCILASRDWRWTFWVAGFLAGGVAWMVVFVPETYEGRDLKEGEGGGKKRREGLKLLWVCVTRPLHMILTEPLILPSGLVVSVTQSILFAYYVIYYILFKNVYGFTEYQVGMAFSPVLIGMVLAAPVVALFDRLTYQKARKAGNSGESMIPEIRLYPTMLGVILQPMSLLWLAWTGRSDIPWIVPVLSGGLFGFAYVLNMLGIPVYNNEVYGTRFGASALAATSFMRFTISSAFPLFTAKMVSRLGFAWATSLLGFITVAMIPIPWVFYKWGPVLRSKSRYLKV